MQLDRQCARAVRHCVDGGASQRRRHIPSRAKGRLGIAGLGFAVALGMFCARAPAADATANVDWSTAEVVKVLTTEYDFVPNRLVFRRGGVYRLHLENSGREMHELTSASFFKAIKMKNPELLVEAGNEVVLQPKEQMDVYFIAIQPGRYHLTCSDHDWAGMTGEIIIE